MAIPDNCTMRILVVDDELLNRKHLSRLLASRVYNAEVVTDGEQALATFREKPHDAAVIDVNLGKGIDGIEVAKQMRRLAPNVHIIMMSGDDTNKTRIEEAKLGPLLGKPFDHAELLSRIDLLAR